MIVNLICVDPTDESRILQYRVPENSREMELLHSLFETAGIDHTVLVSAKVKARYVKTLEKVTYKCQNYEVCIFPACAVDCPGRQNPSVKV